MLTPVDDAVLGEARHVEDGERVTFAEGGSDLRAVHAGDARRVLGAELAGAQDAGRRDRLLCAIERDGAGRVAGDAEDESFA